MSRAILLPSSCNPYASRMWINSFKRFMEPHDCKLYVCINSNTDQPVFDEVVSMFSEVTDKIFTRRHMMDHGPVLTWLVKECKEDIVLILEDDFFVMHPTAVDNWFSVVESGQADIVGSYRGSCHPDICAATARKFSLEGELVQQSNLWPCLFASKKDLLMKTDLNFAGKRFEKGKKIPYIDFTPSQDMAGDTFVWMSIQLRGLGAKVHYEPHYRTIEVITNNLLTPPWIHIGGGSSTMNGMLRDENNCTLNNRGVNVLEYPRCPDEGIRENYRRLIGYNAFMCESFPISEESPASYFNEVYSDAINRSINNWELQKNRVDHFKGIFKMVFTPLV